MPKKKKKSFEASQENKKRLLKKLIVHLVFAFQIGFIKLIKAYY